MIFGYPDGTTNYTDVTVMEVMLSSVGRPLYNMRDLDGISLLILYGGEDISPIFYGERSVNAHAPNTPSLRDEKEATFFLECVKRGIPVLAICRGAQLACCLLGGKLWQDVDNHEGHDHVVIVDGKEYTTNSYHHQMMIPHDGMEIIGYTPCLSPYKRGEHQYKDEGDEAEIVFDPDHRVLMIQGHPEWCEPQEDLYQLTERLVKEKLCLN